MKNQTGTSGACRRPPLDVLEAVWDDIPVMISISDPAGRLQYANPAWQQTLGWTVSEAQEVDVLALAYPDPTRRAEVLEFMRRAGRRWQDFEPRTRDGHVIDAAWIRFALANGSSVGFGVEITERKRVERALMDSQARFSRIFQACPVPLAMWTLQEGRILDVNQAWLDLFGFARDEVVGRTQVELRLSEPAARAALVERVDEEGTLRNVEVQARGKSGEALHLVVSVVPVEVPGEAPAAVSALLDVSERERLLQREKAARAVAEAALEQVRALLAITDPALAHLGLDDLLRELLARVKQALGADWAGLSLLDEERRVLCTRAVDGLPLDEVAAVPVPLGQGVSGRIAAEGRPLIVHDLADAEGPGVQGRPPAGLLAGARSVAGAPLYAGGKVIGVVTVASVEPGRFGEDQLTLLKLVADRVAPAIERSHLAERVRAGEERLKALSRRLMRAQEEERRRIAMELHDELGQVLTTAKIRLDAAQRGDVPAALASRLGAAAEHVDEALRRVRDLALDLRPAVIDDLGLSAALRWYVDRLPRVAKIQVDTSIEEVGELPPEVATTCFRVAQEALTNVARHAQARHVWLELHRGPAGVELRIRDDGIGFDAAAARSGAARGASLGILSMQERVALAGGEFRLATVPGGGAEVTVRIPLEVPPLRD